MTNTPKAHQAVLVRPKRRTLTDATVIAISDAIKKNQFPAGSQLPSEFELIQMLGVSRTTLREALRTLEEQGAIHRQRGLGTFVSSRSIIVKDLSINFGITEMITQAGFIPKTIECEVKEGEAHGEVAKSLELEEGTPVYILHRLRLADNTPIVWTEDIVPAAVLDGQIPKESDLKVQSFYDYLERNHNIRIYEGTAVLRPIAASKEVAAKLQIHHNDTLLLISQTDYAENQRPIIYSEEYHLSDKITFLIHRKGPNR